MSLCSRTACLIHDASSAAGDCDLHAIEILCTALLETGNSCYQWLQFAVYKGLIRRAPQACLCSNMFKLDNRCCQFVQSCISLGPFRHLASLCQRNVSPVWCMMICHHACLLNILRRSLGLSYCRHSLQDECRILLLHGLLHLLGYDHELGEEESDSMAQQEQNLLQSLAWKVCHL